MGTAIILFIGAIIIPLRVAGHTLFEPTVLVKWKFPESIPSREYNSSALLRQQDPSQHSLVWDSDNLTMATHSRYPEPLLRRHRSWNDCPNWPATHKCKHMICNIDFPVYCNNEIDLWECQMCFTDKGETSWSHNTLAEHCCEAKRKAEIVWIAIGSTFCLLLLLALGCCMFKQTRDKRKAHDRDRAVQLQDRELGADGTVRWAKSFRRVPVLPVSGNRTFSRINAVVPNAIRVRQGSGGSSGGQSTKAGPSSIPPSN